MGQISQRRLNAVLKELSADSDSQKAENAALTSKTSFVKLDEKTQIISALRKVWLWGAKRKEALRAAKVGHEFWLCAQCGYAFRKLHIAVDHIAPCVPLAGWDSWDGYLERLFCDPSQLQILCKECHQEKTGIERKQKKKTTTKTREKKCTSSEKKILQVKNKLMRLSKLSKNSTRQNWRSIKIIDGKVIR